MSFAYFSGLMTGLFWLIVYVLMAYVGLKECLVKRKVIPCIAICLNLPWEAAAVFHWPNLGGRIVFLGWFLVDLIITYSSFNIIESEKVKKIYYVILVCGVCFNCMMFQNISFMLLSAYIGNLVMSVLFYIERTKINIMCKIPIAIMRLIGNIFALFAFGSYHYIFCIVQTMVLIVDCMYLCYCVGERRRMGGALT